MRTVFSLTRDHHLARLNIFLVTIALIAGMIGCVPISGNLEIHDWYDLDAVRDNLGGNHILMNNLNSTTAGYMELASPTANGGKGWDPIGFVDEYGHAVAVFSGTFDGKAHEIHDLFINRPDKDCVGLFGYVDKGGQIENVGVVDAYVIGHAGTGGVVGANWGTVSNSYSTGNVTGNGFVGGLVGSNVFGTVTSSHFTGSVTGVETVGGLVGANQDTVSNSYATGGVIGEEGVGGLVGFTPDGAVSNSYATGSVTGTSYVGGLVGYMGSGVIVSNSYSTGNVAGNLSVGGLVGANQESTVSNSYYSYDTVLINGQNVITTGALLNEDFQQWLANDKFLDVTERLFQESGYYLINDVSNFKQLLAFGQDDTLKFRLTNDMNLDTEPGFYIPYLAGEFDGAGHKISNLSFKFDFISQVGLFGYLAPGAKVTRVGVENVDVTGESYVGGLVGFSYSGTVSSSYTTGNITGTSYVGGLMGMNWATVSNSYSGCSVTGGHYVGGLAGKNWGTVENSFWDIQTSGQSTSDGGTGKNTTEMKDISTFSGAGWNIVAVALNETNPAYIWNIVNNVTYPFLRW